MCKEVKPQGRCRYFRDTQGAEIASVRQGCEIAFGLCGKDVKSLSGCGVNRQVGCAACAVPQQARDPTQPYTGVAHAHARTRTHARARTRPPPSRRTRLPPSPAILPLAPVVAGSAAILSLAPVVAGPACTLLLPPCDLCSLLPGAAWGRWGRWGSLGLPGAPWGRLGPLGLPGAAWGSLGPPGADGADGSDGSDGPPLPAASCRSPGPTMPVLGPPPLLAARCVSLPLPAAGPLGAYGSAWTHPVWTHCGLTYGFIRTCSSLHLVAHSCVPCGRHAARCC